MCVLLLDTALPARIFLSLGTVGNHLVEPPASYKCRLVMPIALLYESIEVFPLTPPVLAMAKVELFLISRCNTIWFI